MSASGEIVLQNSMISRAWLRDQPFVYLLSCIGACSAEGMAASAALRPGKQRVLAEDGIVAWQAAVGSAPLR
jgi:hypothetical protein